MPRKYELQRVSPYIITSGDNIFFTVVDDKNLIQLAKAADLVLKESGIGELKVRQSDMDLAQRIAANPLDFRSPTKSFKDVSRSMELPDKALDEERTVPLPTYIDKVAQFDRLPRVTTPALAYFALDSVFAAHTNANIWLQKLSALEHALSRYNEWTGTVQQLYHVVLDMEKTREGMEQEASQLREQLPKYFGFFFVTDGESAQGKTQPVGLVSVRAASLNGYKELPKQVRRRLVSIMNDYASGGILHDNAVSAMTGQLSLRRDTRALLRRHELFIGPLSLQGISYWRKNLVSYN